MKTMPVDPLDLPFSVRVERPLGHRGVQDLLRDLYSGTEFDLTKGVMAGPFGNPFLNMIEGGQLGRFGQRPRGISIQRTLYGVVGQTRQGTRPVLWFATDTPATSVYVPFYPTAGNARDPAYATGTVHAFSRDSAWWAFGFVSNWAQLNYKNMTQEYVYPLVEELQTHIDRSREALEATSPTDAQRAEWQVRTQGAVVRRWWELADFLVMAYNDGYLNARGKVGACIGYDPEYMQMVGLNQDVHPIWVQPAAPPSAAWNANPLPGLWDTATLAWRFVAAPQRLAAAADGDAGAGGAALPLGGLVAALLASLSTGVALGRRLERRAAKAAAGGEDRQYNRLL